VKVIFVKINNFIIITCLIISILSLNGTSGSSGSKKWASHNDENRFNCEIGCALNYIKEKNLGSKQGKLNILKFLNFFCVTSESFAYFSSFNSSQTRINNVCFSKVIYDSTSTSFFKNLFSLSLIGKKLSVFQNANRIIYGNNYWLGEGFGLRLGNFLKVSLLRGGVHPNPGPESSKVNLSLLTYNCRGLKDLNKFKRLMCKINKLVDRNHIVALQETHKVEDRQVSLYCQHNYIRNCEQEISGGVMLFFGNHFKIQDRRLDDNSRYIVTALESDSLKIIIGNAYFPNDNKGAGRFGEEFYSNILEVQTKFPDFYTALMGDFNTCFSKYDSLNRGSTKAEVDLVNLLKANNCSCEVRDAYRSINPEGGYTWSRGNCFSRLDYIFVSNDLLSRIKHAKIDWCVEKSDHAAVICGFTIETKFEKGPGIARLNTRLLDDERTKSEIIIQLKELLSQASQNWNPHFKLEFVKMAIRSAFSNVASIRNKDKRLEVEELEVQINRLKIHKEEIAGAGDEVVNLTLRNKIDEAISELTVEIEVARNRFSEDIAFVAGAKWYEEGEKSNKYFLGILNKRVKQKLITNIIEEGEELNTLTEIMNSIKKFYSQLYCKIIPQDNLVNQDNFFAYCPKISLSSKNELDRNVTLMELASTLKTCKDTAPGPDGIPYKIYKELWDLLGIYIVEAWNFSVETGCLPPSHMESVLTLLPKEGKDSRFIKNWRPITLSNCDSKLITKALANRMAKVLEEVIDPSQTAYIPGRSVMDNLRTIFFSKEYCEKNKIDAVLISLDAKKAFDSVDHDYIRKILKVYGFGDKFIEYFNTLYSDLQARIMVNGFFSEIIKIERGVKQGDALSCSLFILCIDPLIRNINMNEKIKRINFKSRKDRSEPRVKASGYADDIAIICKNDLESIMEVFKEYEKLTIMSGLELNADKTEFLQLGSIKEEKFKFSYLNCNYSLDPKSEVKICGLYFCNDKDKEYEENIMAKIEKLENQLRKWMCRNLTLEGKILIVKTYGLSQLIYNLQCHYILEKEIILVERLIYKFIWSKKWTDSRTIDRIKRSVLKNELDMGGLKAPDIDCLDKALKLKQFIRASKSTNVIKSIQEYSIVGEIPIDIIRQEYYKISQDEWVVRSGQGTINKLTDWARSSRYGNNDNGQSSIIAINTVGSIDISTYLERKNEILANCVFKEIKKEGIENLNEVLQELEFNSHETTIRNLKYIVSCLDQELIEIAKNYNSEINSGTGELTHLYIGNDLFIPTNQITVKILQKTLKVALNKVSVIDYESKLDIDNFSLGSLASVRQAVCSVKLRNIFYRLINGDFFSRSRMVRFKMVEDSDCERCGMEENSRHLLWECQGAKRGWDNLNVILSKLDLPNERIYQYQDLFNFECSSAAATIRLRLINELIQIARPNNLTEEYINRMIKNLMNTEKYIAIKNKSLARFEKKWGLFTNL